MSKIFTLFISILIIASSLPTLAADQLKSYDLWRSEKIFAAQKKIEETKQTMESYRVRGEVVPPHLNQQLSQEQWSLESARELSVNDYFILYMSKPEFSAQFSEATSKLGTAEVQEILQAYARIVNPAVQAKSLNQMRTAETK